MNTISCITGRRFYNVAFAYMKKISHFFDFATTFFSVSSASLLDFSFSQPLLYFFIFIFKLAKVLRLETFRLVNIGISVVGYLP